MADRLKRKKGIYMPNSNDLQRELSRTLLPEFIRNASRVAGFKLRKPEFASARNISGIRTKEQTYSQRHDCRTLFASDTRYGYTSKGGTWVGPDKRSIAMCRRVLTAAGVPSKEIQKVVPVSEMGQLAERTSEERFEIKEPTVLRKLAKAHRALEGIPVWSSYATVGLTRKGALGWLEIHWPEITNTILMEAKVLQRLVKKRGYKAPNLLSAEVERIEVGVVHSPAIGFYMDIVPAIRLIYRAEDRGLGRKPVLYLDRHGEQIAMPRDVDPMKPPRNDREEAQPRQADL